MAALPGFRKVERWVDNAWQRIPFRSLREGDIFRLFEPGAGQVVGMDGANMFKATSKPGPTDRREIWGIQADPVHDEPVVEG